MFSTRRSVSRLLFPKHPKPQSNLDFQRNHLPSWLDPRSNSSGSGVGSRWDTEETENSLSLSFSPPPAPRSRKGLPDRCQSHRFNRDLWVDPSLSGCGLGTASSRGEGRSPSGVGNECHEVARLDWNRELSFGFPQVKTPTSVPVGEYFVDPNLYRRLILTKILRRLTDEWFNGTIPIRSQRGAIFKGKETQFSLPR